MILEQQVTSLELSKRLKQLGVRQDGYFYWINELDEIIEGWHLTDEDSWQEHEDEHGSGRLFSEYSKYSAFTVAELGEMLPTDNFYTCYSFKTTKSNDSRVYWMSKRTSGEKAHYEEDFTEANARAKLLIYLLENKLITL